MHWREYGLDLFAWADGSWDHLLPSTQAPLSSPPHPNHVTVQHVHTDTLKHIIFEDKSLPETVLNQLFPPSSRRVTRPSSGRGTPGRMWICQLPGCGRSVRRQERVAHALQHRGKNRFTCSCGGSFARSQDKKRHLREQKICANCTRPVGRNGANGCCFMCIQL
ncbi:hypothetical protein JB92DRAFT_128963 [Gautieria morchelliformis]|nr:hypothetical protein JB92DRAFT_128963 [Gautieria morchelliformis]